MGFIVWTCPKEGRDKFLGRWGDGIIFFWDARGIIHIDSLKKRKEIDREYYTHRFNENWKRQRHIPIWGIWPRKKVLFFIMIILNGKTLWIKLLIGASSWWLLHITKPKKIAWHKGFSSHKDIIDYTKAWFRDIEKSCIDVRGYIIE